MRMGWLVRLSILASLPVATLPGQASRPIDKGGKLAVEPTMGEGGAPRVKPSSDATHFLISPAFALTIRTRVGTVIASAVRLEVNKTDSTGSLEQVDDTLRAWSPNADKLTKDTTEVTVTLTINDQARATTFFLVKGDSPRVPERPLCAEVLLQEKIAEAERANGDRGAFLQGFRKVSPAWIVVDKDGRIRVQPREGIREDQQLKVRLLAVREGDLDNLYVERTTATRTAGQIAVAGQPPPTQTTSSEPPRLADASSTCVDDEVTGDYAPGEGKFEIKRVTVGNDQKVTRETIRTISIPVRRVFHAQLSVGIARSSVLAPNFELAQQPEKTSAGADTTVTIIRDTEDSTKRLVPVVFLTAFLPASLDLDGPNASRDLSWWLSPSVGFNPQRFGDEWFLGVSAHVSRVLMLHVGKHISRGKTLRSGVKTNEPYTGDATKVPTINTTRTKTFYSATIDGAAAAVWFSEAIRKLFDGWGSSKPAETPPPKESTPPK